MKHIEIKMHQAAIYIINPFWNHVLQISVKRKMCQRTI